MAVAKSGRAAAAKKPSKPKATVEKEKPTVVPKRKIRYTKLVSDLLRAISAFASNNPGESVLELGDAALGLAYDLGLPINRELADNVKSLGRLALHAKTKFDEKRRAEAGTLDEVIAGLRNSPEFAVDIDEKMPKAPVSLKSKITQTTQSTKQTFTQTNQPTKQTFTQTTQPTTRTKQTYTQSVPEKLVDKALKVDTNISTAGGVDERIRIDEIMQSVETLKKELGRKRGATESEAKGLKKIKALEMIADRVKSDGMESSYTPPVAPTTDTVIKQATVEFNPVIQPRVQRRPKQSDKMEVDKMPRGGGSKRKVEYKDMMMDVDKQVTGKKSGGGPKKKQIKIADFSANDVVSMRAMPDKSMDEDVFEYLPLTKRVRAEDKEKLKYMRI